MTRLLVQFGAWVELHEVVALGDADSVRLLLDLGATLDHQLVRPGRLAYLSDATAETVAYGRYACLLVLFQWAASRGTFCLDRTDLDLVFGGTYPQNGVLI